MHVGTEHSINEIMHSRIDGGGSSLLSSGGMEWLVGWMEQS